MTLRRVAFVVGVLLLWAVGFCWAGYLVGYRARHADCPAGLVRWDHRSDHLFICLQPGMSPKQLQMLVPAGRGPLVLR